MDWRIPKAAYVHVPFCAHHCGYCDFAVSTGQDHLITLYLEALAVEMAGEPADVRTVFIGGGTPTHLSAAQLETLMRIIRSRFPNAVEEFSVESTPESITPEKLRLLKDHGLTRISIGVQSFENDTLRALDRRHSVSQIDQAVQSAREMNLEYSLDLIFGAPGQSLESWRSDLARAIAFEPGHISTYGLTYEKGTPLWKQWNAGDVKDAGEDLELLMYEAAIETLTGAGYEHYEISNFAKHGKRCRHNEIYWANHAYFGFGVGAARYIQGERSVNLRATKTYIERLLAGESVVQHRETLPLRERAFETMAVQLRRCDGIDPHTFEHQTGFDLYDLAGTTIRELTRQGLLAAAPTAIRLTPRGKCVADAVITKLMTSGFSSPPS